MLPRFTIKQGIMGVDFVVCNTDAQDRVYPLSVAPDQEEALRKS